MPTPFTHLEIAQRLLSDTQVNPAHRDLINAHQERIAYVNVSTDSVLRDVDTPDDYEQERFRAGLGRHGKLAQ